MFRPNLPCRIQLASGKTDVYGQPTPATFVNERCSIVRLTSRSEKTSVRADSSASRGNARELQADAVILLTIHTKARIDDVVEVSGVKLKITSIFPQHDVNGRLDHYEVEAHIWSGK